MEEFIAKFEVFVQGIDPDAEFEKEYDLGYRHGYYDALVYTLEWMLEEEA